MSIGKRVKKMINRNIPKIRFKEFINNWNNYKLGQLGKFKSGIGFPDSQQGGTEGIPFFKVSDMNNIGNETEMRNANNYVTQEQIMKNSWKVIDETPAIIFAKVGAALMLNRKRLVTRPFLIDNNTMSYSFDESWDKDFGLTLFQTINLPKYAQIGALPSYNASDIAMIKVNVPNVQEQSAIGFLFRTIDALLASYKDNLANYKSLKATMLSKMFPKAGETVPEIRLDGFEGEWERNKLNKYLTVSKKKNIKQQFGKEDVLSVSGEVGIVNQIQFQGRSFAGVSVEMYSIVETGNIVYTKSPLKANPYGIIKTNYGIPGIVSTLYAVYLPYENVFPEFVERYFENDLRLNSYLKPLVNKGAKNDMKVSDENALLGNVIFPKLEEQVAISDYFTNFDKFIQSHKDKISQLETLKKKLLQDMFI